MEGGVGIWTMEEDPQEIFYLGTRCIDWKTAQNRNYTYAFEDDVFDTPHQIVRGVSATALALSFPLLLASFALCCCGTSMERGLLLTLGGCCFGMSLLTMLYLVSTSTSK